MTKQTLHQAIKMSIAGTTPNMKYAGACLLGQPCGAGAPRIRARNTVDGFLPPQSDRDYSTDDYIDALYDSAGAFYRVKK